MFDRNPHNVYLALAVLVGSALMIIYFFGWRSMVRRDQDLQDIYPPHDKRD